MIPQGVAENVAGRFRPMKDAGDPVDCPPESRQPMVNEKLGKLAGRIELLEQTSGELYKRLDPVLRNEPTPGDECCKAPECPCPVAESIDMLANRVSGVMGVLQDALNRLEV
jgi:hypothetical protein